MKQFISYTVLVLFILGSFSSSLFIGKPETAHAYTRNNLCSDQGFVNVNTLNEGGIQSFLESKGSFLKDFTNNGKRASKIIYEASRENGVNPIAILAMIQKEEGIIYGNNAATFNQTRVDWAMGYGYTDSVIYQRYKGFETQVDYGSWQLRRNFDYWATNGSAWNVGKTMNIDGTNVTFGNKCTSAQYRYTPHLGTNFAYYFEAWGGEGTYDASYRIQGPKTGAGSANAETLPAQHFTIWVYMKNTGTNTWYRTGATPVHLGTSGPPGRQSIFLGNRSVRGYMVQTRVRPGEYGTFKLRLKAPVQEGIYEEKFQLVSEYVAWFGPELTWRVNVSVNSAASQTKATYITQGPRTGAGSFSGHANNGEKFTLWVSYRNTGTRTWYRDGIYATHLGATDPIGRSSAFSGAKRGYLVQSTVAPGQIGTFRIRLTAPNQDGVYYEKFQPVTEYIKWIDPSAYWKITVR